MKCDLQPALDEWAPSAKKPIEAISRLHEAGVRVALCSSQLSYLVAKALGLPIAREPDDIDLLIPNPDLALAANILGADINVDKHVAISTANGTLYCTGNEAAARIAGSIIQMVCPTTPMWHQKDPHTKPHPYFTEFTDEAAQNRTIYLTEFGYLPVAEPDAAYLYAILGRTEEGKTDSQNLAILREAFDLSDPYASGRAVEMNLDTRAYNNIHTAGLVAVQPQLVLAV